MLVDRNGVTGYLETVDWCIVLIVETLVLLILLLGCIDGGDKFITRPSTHPDISNTQS